MVSKDKTKEYMSRVEACVPEMLRCIHISVPREVLGLKLTISQSVTLSSLGYKRSCKMSELAQSISMNMSTLTPVVDSLIQKRLVLRRRSKDDRRVVLVQLTEKGKKAVSGINRYKRKQIKDIIEYFPEKDREQVLLGFENMVKAFTDICNKKSKNGKDK